MKNIISIELVKNTIHKEIRNKSIIFLFVFTLAFIFSGHLLAITLKGFIDESNLNTFIANSSQGVIINFVSFCTNIVCSIIAASAVRSDLGSGVISQILSFPISRSKYLISRVAGSLTLSFLFYLLSLLFGIALLVFGESIKIDFYGLLISSLFMGLQILGLVVVGIFASLYFKRLGAFLVTFTYYIVSKIVYHSVSYEGVNFDTFSLGKAFKYFVYFCTPRVAEVSYMAEEFINGSEFEYMTLVYGLSHFILLVGIWSILMKVVFNKREF